MTGVRHLAQFNIARIRYPLDDPRMAEFVTNVDRVNRLAEKIEGFVWRLQDDSGHAMNMTVYDDPRILPNLTVWEGAEALERFVFKTVHSRFYGRREEWFEPLDRPLVMWFVPAGHRPSLSEGVERLEDLNAHGPSDRAFGWESLPATQLWKAARCGTSTGHAALSRPANKNATGEGQSLEQSHVMGQSESPVLQLQVLVADCGRGR